MVVEIAHFLNIGRLFFGAHDFQHRAAEAEISSGHR